MDVSLLPRLLEYPEIILFFVVAIGHYLGKIKIGPLQLGGVCGTLLLAIFVGQLGVKIDPGLKNIFFAVFIFALGYSGGPQFFANLNAKGLRLGVLSIIEVAMVIALIMAYVHIFHFDPGTAAGLVAGSATESAVIGTASEAISRLPLSHEEIAVLQGNVVTAYSITYVFGLTTIVLFTSQFAPLLLKINLRAAAEKLWTDLGGGSQNSTANDSQALSAMEGRVFHVETAAGSTVAAVNKLLGAGAHIERIKRDGNMLTVAPELKLIGGDRVMVMGRRDAAMLGSALIGPEVAGSRGFNMAVETDQFVLNNPDVHNQTIAELLTRARDNGLSAEVHVESVIRGGNSMPAVPGLRLNIGDVLSLYGTHEQVQKVGALLGKAILTSNRANFIYISLGIILGILIGRIELPLGGIALSLGTGGGALLTGLVFGWWRTRHPAIAATPPAALEIMKDLGLTVFVACVGLSAGPQAWQLVKQYGLLLPAIGISVALLPAMVSLLVGRGLLKIEIPILLGGIAGQQCSTPALSAVQNAAGNTTPLIGYTITYAISNAILPLLGPVVVGLAQLAGGG